MFDLVAPETLLMASLLVTGILLFISVYFMITLSDLESDYLNSRQCSDRLNLFTWPRLALLALHSILNLSSFWLLLLSLPSTLWLAYRTLRIPSGNSGLYDPTEVHVRSNLRASIKESLAYMGYHMFSFFIYMWLLVSSLTQNQINPIAPQEMPW